VEARRIAGEEDPSGIDAVGRHELVLRLEIDRRPAELLSHAVAAHDDTGDGVRPAEHARRRADLPLPHRAADAGAGDPLPFPVHLFDAEGAETQALSHLPQQLQTPLALVAEDKPLAD